MFTLHKISQTEETPMKGTGNLLKITVYKIKFDMVNHFKMAGRTGSRLVQKAAVWNSGLYGKIVCKFRFLLKKMTLTSAYAY